MIVLHSYEMPLVLKGSAAEKETKESLDGVKKLIEDGKGEIGEIEEWGKKTLQYEIKKESSGLFYLINFEADHKAIPNLGKKLQMSENLLRFIIIKKVPLKKVKDKKSSKAASKKEVN